MLGKNRRLAVLAEGSFTPLDGKTAVGVLRYRPREVVAVIDSTRAGRTAAECTGVGGAIPVVADVAAAAARGADGLLIGIAPQGGELPPAWRTVVHDALARGWDVLSGLHAFLADDPELAALAAAHGGRLIDVRRPPARRPVAAARAADASALVVLTVGSDCNVGKMTAGLELRAALEARGTRAAFVATGQTGIFVADQGTAVDAVPADFVAGVVEEMVLAAARGEGGDAPEVVIVEGQGALHHPGYSGVTLALLHGAAPGAMVLCHASARDRVRVGGRSGAPGLTGGPAVPPLAELVRVYEQAAAWVRPAPVVAIALNTLGLDEGAARAAVAAAARETGLPAGDPVRFGAEPIAAAVLDHLNARRRHATAT
ncbi:MAG: DUF1611 domain-containing protein [Candidatus Eisenbacteria bacterium]|uniref:DUF1611 domain-containing protein n=1 Tax=Eiseniibacteriota bacterium TaxID=2212470 RepID=A0A9D6L960_UNCEI|nr:DUF1611 domain-containing protein [Candidatus Eisenbacteria bacterium]MBI3539940.1 DUF1611 domain-containing protein [Candidatus Eisenbacteria bacterium]